MIYVGLCLRYNLKHQAYYKGGALSTYIGQRRFQKILRIHFMKVFKKY